MFILELYIVDDARLISEWDWDINSKFGFSPKQISVNSKKKVHWVCSKGHKWPTDPYHRFKGGTNCPYCMNKKVLFGFNDLASCRPDLMAEWDYEKNSADPTKIMYQSSKRVFWRCEKGHSWNIPVYKRTVNGTNCPYCSNKKVLPGFNDLQSQYPNLMLEWDFEKNIIDPTAVVCGSNKIAHWKCQSGHNYTKSIYRRVNGESCPSCNQGRGTSFPEQCFYYYIKKMYPDAVSRYKDIFENQMELDIYIPSIKTGIEYDGLFWHKKNSKVLRREEKKYLICKENGIQLFRIKEGEFDGFTDTAKKIWYIPVKCDYSLLDFYILEFLKQLTVFSNNLPSVNVERDKTEILEYRTMRYEDSLAGLYPDIAREWHPTRNGNLLPEAFPPGTAETVWWLCSSCGNEWKASIVSRTKGHGCDICATKQRKITKKETILQSRGSISSEICLLDWDYENNEHRPEYYTNGSGEVVNWKCHVCGYRWSTPICSRTRDYKNGCPLCSGKTIVAGVNDIATLRPDLLEEWDYEYNVSLDVTKVGVGSHEYANWKCKKCSYRWRAQIYNRASGKGCPCCANRIVVAGINDLSTTDPDIAKDWHPILNGDLTPQQVTRGQSRKIWWLCSCCGEEWQNSLNHRCCGDRGCRTCKKNNKLKT